MNRLISSTLAAAIMAGGIASTSSPAYADGVQRQLDQNAITMRELQSRGIMPGGQHDYRSPSSSDPLGTGLLATIILIGGYCLLTDGCGTKPRERTANKRVKR